MDSLGLQQQINDLREAFRRHTHDNGETFPIASMQVAYFSKEFNNGNVTSTATIDWSKSNVQYVTLTGNTTFTFIGAQPGYRHILHVAGAFTPTWPSNVKWSAATVPTATASAGFKDIYSFVYSGIENLYDCIQSANFSTS